MDPQLISYVQQQRANGYSDEQIAAALRKVNYPESLISATLRAAQSPQADPRLLKTYADTYRQQGYSESQIQSGLTNQGFSENAVSDIAQHKKPRHLSLLFLFPLLAGIILVGGFLLITNDEPIIEQPTTIEEVQLGDIITHVLPLAKHNPEAALALCEEVIPADKSRCILTVSRESSSPALCEDITNIRIRDQCYIDFIYDGNIEFCPKLALESNIQYCDVVA